MRTRRYFPKTYPTQQGKRKNDKWGLCQHCGDPTSIRCHKCERWICNLDLKLRRAQNAIGVYFTICQPGCRKRMANEAAKRVKRKIRKTIVPEDWEQRTKLPRTPENGSGTARDR